MKRLSYNECKTALPVLYVNAIELFFLLLFLFKTRVYITYRNKVKYQISRSLTSCIKLDLRTVKFGPHGKTKCILSEKTLMEGCSILKVFT